MPNILVEKPKLRVDASDARQIRDWLANRGGLAVWESVDLSRPGDSVTTPVLKSDGNPTPKPYYWVGAEPARIITDPDEVEVARYREVKRFHVATRLGAQGFKVKVTDGGTRRINREVRKAGPGATYVFDYGDYNNAVILAPDGVVPLKEFDSA